MQAGNESIQEEMREVQKEIEEEDEEESIALEEGRHSPSAEGGNTTSRPLTGSRSRQGRHQQHDGPQQWLQGARNLLGFIFTPIFIQSFVLTFLAEWGDRSQITTIALGAAHVSLPSLNSPSRKYHS